jgi:ring-1,2-phenylacetyl-CoA epoxidase subunit PaaC
VTEDLRTENDEALAALVNLLVVLADNKWYLGLHTSEWAVGAPVLESSVACAAIAQGHMGQARVLYPLLEELPSPVTATPPDKGGAPRRRYNVSALDDPFPTWPRTVAALLLIDGGLNTMLNALRASSYEPLVRRVGRMLEDERFHRDFADGRVRELCAFEPGRELLQAEVDRLLPEMLCWFGPSSEPGVRALAAEGMIDGDGDRWRATYLDRVAPVLTEVRVALREDEELPWDRWNGLQRRLT